jgi:hypothetical protein
MAVCKLFDQRGKRAAGELKRLQRRLMVHLEETRDPAALRFRSDLGQ